MINYENSSLWKKSLGIQGDQSVDRLRTSYLSFRDHMIGLLDEVRIDFPNLTDHSIEHVDNLWRIASLLTGGNYPINPLEGFVLGCAFLIHDSVLSYKAFGGKEGLRDTIDWKDYYQDIIGTEYDTEEGKQQLDFTVIRLLHARKCSDVLFRQFEGMDGNNFYLLSDDELRIHYGQLIGEIASSHHWETEMIASLPSQVNGLTSLSTDWPICPRKLACILRCADAASIDSGRAPDYLFRLLRLNGVSRDHWVAQNRLEIAPDVNDSSRLVYTSTHDFEEKDFAAWNVAYDAVKVVEDELNKCQGLLSEHEQFQVKGVTGAKSRKELAQYIKTKDWMPSDANVHISDVEHLIMTLGGKELYGQNDVQLLVLRELIQNARDAIHARRLMEQDDSIGKISIRVCKSGVNTVVSVTDNGVGMSLSTISNSLLNFGNSFWHGDAVHNEFPGLKMAGFKSVGQFGIGFFSVFMIAKTVVIETRKFSDGLDNAHLVKFPSGFTLTPIFANCTSTSTLYSTKISYILGEMYKDWPEEYEVRRSKMNSKNFRVPFHAMLSTLVAGLDVDVYYQEFEKENVRIHHRIDAADLDKKAWLRSLSLADYQQDKNLDAYIEGNYNRLCNVYDDNNRIVGLAAIGTRFLPYEDFLGGSTVGGLLTEFHSRTGEYWIGILDKTPGGAKRSGDVFKASETILRTWAQKQVSSLGNKALNDIQMRFRLQLAMHFFKTDPKGIAVAFCVLDNKMTQQMMVSLDVLVNHMSQGKKLIFVDSDFMSHKDNQGYGDAYLDVSQVATLLNSDEILYVPLMNYGFLNYKLVNGFPVNDNGFIDCLYRIAVDMGHNLVFSYRENYTKNRFGMNERALVIEKKIDDTGGEVVEKL
jgi:hypothetical protein